MLRSDLCDPSDAYTAVRGTITVSDPDDAKRKKSVAFKNNAPFINCISKINSVQIDNAEDLDVVMSIYNLLEYSKNYRKATGSLWNCYRDEPSISLSSNSESFKYKASPSQQILFPRTSWWRPTPTSPGRPLKILFDRPGNVPNWRPWDVPIWRPGDVLKWHPVDIIIWRSSKFHGRLIQDIPRMLSGCTIADL